MQTLSALFARTMVSLLAVFVLLEIVSTFLVRLPALAVAAPAVAAGMLWTVGALVESIMWARHVPKLVRMRARLSALCLGVSLRPFCWELGRASDQRKPGQGVVAIGPFRLCWRLSSVAVALEVLVCDAMEQAHRAGLCCCDNCHAARRDRYRAVTA